MKPVIRPLEDLLPVDDLDQAIVNLSTRINAETYELLVLIRQFDERAGWLKWGLGNCAEWLHYRCDLSMNAAREKVRVAHALKTLANIAAAFATGEISYSKVRDDSAPKIEFVDESWSARQADAMVSMASSYLSGNDKQVRSRSDDYLVTIHVDQACASGKRQRLLIPRLSPHTLCRCPSH